jgi:hypothetical protein
MTSTVKPPSTITTRADVRFKSAATLLQDAVPTELCERLGKLSFPKLENIETVQQKACEVESFLEKAIQTREEIAKDPQRKKNFEDLILSWFVASYPFASLFLTVTQRGASVFLRPYNC